MPIKLASCLPGFCECVDKDSFLQPPKTVLSEAIPQTTGRCDDLSGWRQYDKASFPDLSQPFLVQGAAPHYFDSKFQCRDHSLGIHISGDMLFNVIASRIRIWIAPTSQTLGSFSCCFRQTHGRRDNCILSFGAWLYLQDKKTTKVTFNPMILEF